MQRLARQDVIITAADLHTMRDTSRESDSQSRANLTLLLYRVAGEWCSKCVRDVGQPMVGRPCSREVPCNTTGEPFA
jgi:hypothetical protein